LKWILLVLILPFIFIPPFLSTAEYHIEPDYEYQEIEGTYKDVLVNAETWSERSITHDSTIRERVASNKEVEDYIRIKAEEKGVDERCSVELGIHESLGLTPDIKNPISSALGLYQIIDGTWNQFCSDLERKGNWKHQADCYFRIMETPKGYENWIGERGDPGTIEAMREKNCLVPLAKR